MINKKENHQKNKKIIKWDRKISSTFLQYDVRTSTDTTSINNTRKKKWKKIEIDYSTPPYFLKPQLKNPINYKEFKDILYQSFIYNDSSKINGIVYFGKHTLGATKNFGFKTNCVHGGAIISFISEIGNILIKEYCKLQKEKEKEMNEKSVRKKARIIIESYEFEKIYSLCHKVVSTEQPLKFHCNIQEDEPTQFFEILSKDKKKIEEEEEEEEEKNFKFVHGYISDFFNESVKLIEVFIKFKEKTKRRDSNLKDSAHFKSIKKGEIPSEIIDQIINMLLKQKYKKIRFTILKKEEYYKIQSNREILKNIKTINTLIIPNEYFMLEKKKNIDKFMKNPITNCKFWFTSYFKDGSSKNINFFYFGNKSKVNHDKDEVNLSAVSALINVLDTLSVKYQFLKYSTSSYPIIKNIRIEKKNNDIKLYSFLKYITEFKIIRKIKSKKKVDNDNDNCTFFVEINSFISSLDDQIIYVRSTSNFIVFSK